MLQILSVLCEVPVSSLHGSKSSILVTWLPHFLYFQGRLFSAHCLVPLASHEMVSWHTVDSASSLTLYSEGAGLSPVCVPSVPFQQPAYVKWAVPLPSSWPCDPPGLSSLYLFSGTLVPIHATSRKYLLYFQQPEASLWEGWCQL